MCCGKSKVAQSAQSQAVARGFNPTGNYPVTVEYHGESGTLIGAVTHHNYGYKEDGDVFQAWSRDVDAAAEGLFTQPERV